MVPFIRCVSVMSDTEKLLHDLAKFPEINPGAVVRLDAAGRILLANKAARALFKDESLTGQNWLTVCPAVTSAVWQEIQRTDEPFKYEVQVGDCIVLFTFVRPEESEFIFAYGSDVTAFREAEQRLAEQTSAIKELARFPDMNPGPVLRLNFDGIVLLANSAARDLFGEDLVGQNWMDVFPSMNPSVWAGIHSTTEITSLEVQINKCDYLFSHRCDTHSSLVFVYGSDITLLKKTERALLQSEKMATLGTLAAGVAHELNNPAAATRRAADQLRTAFSMLEQSHLLLERYTLSSEAIDTIRSVDARARTSSVKIDYLDSLTRSDLEADVEDWLDEQSVRDASSLAPALVSMEFSPADLQSLMPLFPDGAFDAFLQWSSSVHSVYTLLHEISQGSSRISEIVGAMKGYSYLGQAPIQSVNIHEGIDNTLIILRNKMKTGITVTREYDPRLKNIEAYGSELNQVWTNILDNAADALNGKGQIIIRTMQNNGSVRIDIEDNGPGIPPEIQTRIFDPFFTTKDLGKGTGLGLSTTYGIVTEKHHGRLTVESQPGSTRFIIELPVALTHSNTEKEQSS